MSYELHRSAERVFRDAVSYMTEKSGEMPGIEEIARACHTSCTGLQNVFRSYSGLSVHRYLMKLKINTAVKLLGQGKTVTETALELGFQSQSHFSNVFKKETGVCPGKDKYRGKAARTGKDCDGDCAGTWFSKSEPLFQCV